MSRNGAVATGDRPIADQIANCFPEASVATILQKTPRGIHTLRHEFIAALPNEDVLRKMLAEEKLNFDDLRRKHEQVFTAFVTEDAKSCLGDCIAWVANNLYLSIFSSFVYASATGLLKFYAGDELFAANTGLLSSVGLEQTVAPTVLAWLGLSTYFLVYFPSRADTAIRRIFWNKGGDAVESRAKKAAQRAINKLAVIVGREKEEDAAKAQNNCVRSCNLNENWGNFFAVIGKASAIMAGLTFAVVLAAWITDQATQNGYSQGDYSNSQVQVVFEGSIAVTLLTVSWLTAITFYYFAVKEADDNERKIRKHLGGWGGKFGLKTLVTVAGIVYTARSLYATPYVMDALRFVPAVNTSAIGVCSIYTIYFVINAVTSYFNFWIGRSLRMSKANEDGLDWLPKDEGLLVKADGTPWESKDDGQWHYRDNALATSVWLSWLILGVFVGLSFFTNAQMLLSAVDLSYRLGVSMATGEMYDASLVAGGNYRIVLIVLAYVLSLPKTIVDQTYYTGPNFVSRFSKLVYDTLVAGRCCGLTPYEKEPSKSGRAKRVERMRARDDGEKGDSLLVAGAVRHEEETRPAFLGKQNGFRTRD